jgi:hypothetical protein
MFWISAGWNDDWEGLNDLVDWDFVCAFLLIRSSMNLRSSPPGVSAREL